MSYNRIGEFVHDPAHLSSRSPGFMLSRSAERLTFVHTVATWLLPVCFRD